MKNTCLAALALILGLAAGPTRAGVVLIDPYDNALAPDGVYTLAYPVHLQASEFMGPTGEKAADADFKLDVVFARVIAYRHVGKIPLAFQIIQPFGRVQESKFLDATSSGMGDLIFGPGAFLYANDASGTYLSYWLYAYAPTGAFDRSKPVNLGAHHWYFEHQLAVNQTFLSKKIIFDANLNFYHHAEEPDTRLGSPLRFELAAIVGYQVTEKLIAGVNGGAYWDLGDSKVSGVAMPDTAARSASLGPALSYQLTPKLGATFRWTHDVSVANDFKGDGVWLRASYAF
jgi:hypothetical protein